MKNRVQQSRRAFLGKTGLIIGSAVTGSISGKHTSRFPDDNAEVSPAEDLMREHGVLKRVLLIYDEFVKTIASGAEVPPETLKGAADIIHTFIESYHEKLEEDHIFPRFEKAHTLVDLVSILRTQHERGRLLTGLILKSATEKDIRDPESSKRIANHLRLFVRMYNPHEAWEDTVLFPAFRKLVTKTEYDSLGEQFEDREHELFGGEGFELYVDKVARLEKTVGLYDLSRFTPEVK